MFVCLCSAKLYNYDDKNILAQCNEQKLTESLKCVWQGSTSTWARQPYTLAAMWYAQKRKKYVSAHALRLHFPWGTTQDPRLEGRPSRGQRSPCRVETFNVSEKEGIKTGYVWAEEVGRG